MINKQTITVQKVLNNNVIIADHPIYEEVVLIGKGIGFNRKSGSLITNDAAEKTFLLRNEKERENYVNLLPNIDEGMVDFMNDVMVHIESRMDHPLNEHIHVALTDHIAFAISRVKKQIQFSNPFLFETESLYPKEYQVANEIIDMIHEKFDVQFPEGETGFIALHIHSSVTDKSIKDINRHNKLIGELVDLTERTLMIELDKQGVNYHRLVQHFHRAIERVYNVEKPSTEIRLKEMLKTEYPVCYNLAWKLIKIMQNRLNKNVDEAEIVYITIHLHRLTL
ncbi:glucose PTS transporter transcription antiterminator GlcT [Virgibacillus sp. DJP39]|uniref:glucose PTS transporter transcription antiterminator GlcT n=1 Tax=Virgibacillus sp. DJP39 TaxID=3409790 RepID=UPI003BB76C40